LLKHLASIILVAFFVNILLLFSNVLALDCSNCEVGACYCHVTECPSGTMSVYLTQCTGIPSKEIIFANSSFVWIGAQAKNYYFEAFCDLGIKSNCTNVNLTSSIVTTTTTTSSTTTTIFVPQKSICPFDCCVGDPDYYSKYCDEGYECMNNQCISTATTQSEENPQINYSLIGTIVVVIIVAVFVLYFWKMRKPEDKWKHLYQKYGRR